MDPRSQLFAVATVCLFNGSAQAATLFTYDFPGIPGSGLTADQTATVPAGLSFSDFTRSNVIEYIGNNVFNSNNWNINTAIDLSEYIQFTMTVDPGYSATLASLQFFQRGSDTVADEFRVAVSLDNFGSTTESSDGLVSFGGLSETWDFTDLILSGGDTVYFRWYVFGDTQTGGSGSPLPVGTFRLDDVSLNGAITPPPAVVPEPPLALALSVTGLLLSAGLRRIGRR